MTRLLDPTGRLIIRQSWQLGEEARLSSRIGAILFQWFLYAVLGLMSIAAVFLVLNGILNEAHDDRAAQALAVFITLPMVVMIVKSAFVDWLFPFFRGQPRHLADPVRRELVLEMPGIIQSSVRRIPAADVAEIATLVEHHRESTGYDPIDGSTHQLVARLRSGEIVRLGGANATSAAGEAPPAEMIATRGDIIAALGYADASQSPLASTRSLPAPEVLSREYGFVESEIDLGRRYLFLSTRPRSWLLAQGMRYYTYASVLAWLALCALQAWNLLWLGFFVLTYLLAFAEVMQTYQARSLTFDGAANALTVTEMASRYGLRSTSRRIVAFPDIRQILVGATRDAAPQSPLYLHARTRQVDIVLASGEQRQLYLQTRLSPDRDMEDPLLRIVTRLLGHAQVVDHS